MYTANECYAENVARKDHDDALKARNFGDMVAISQSLNGAPIKTHVGRVHIVFGELQDMDADAYVNTANELLEGGGGVDEMIHAIGGPTLLDEVRAIPKHEDGARVHEGEAVVTSAPNFKASKIIHAVAPYLDRYGRTKPHVLTQCYISILARAKEHGLRTVAIPSLGTGFYGFPMLDAIMVALDALQKHIPHSGVEKVMLVFNSMVNYNIAVAHCTSIQVA